MLHLILGEGYSRQASPRERIRQRQPRSVRPRVSLRPRFTSRPTSSRRTVVLHETCRSATRIDQADRISLTGCSHSRSGCYATGRWVGVISRLFSGDGSGVVRHVPARHAVRRRLGYRKHKPTGAPRRTPETRRVPETPRRPRPRRQSGNQQSAPQLTKTRSNPHAPGARSTRRRRSPRRTARGRKPKSPRRTPARSRSRAGKVEAGHRRAQPRERQRIHPK